MKILKLNLKSLLIIASLIIILSGVVGCTKNTNSQLTEVRIGYQKFGTLIYLKQKQLLEKHFAEQNIKLSWLEFPSGPPLLEALNSGSIDIGSTGESPPIFAQAAGSNLRYIGRSAASPECEAILVPKHSPITQLSELKGKRIAVTKGSSAHLLLVLALEKVGIKLADVTPVYLQPADGRAAFEQGGVDAWVVWDPYYSAVTEQLGAQVIADSSGLKPGYEFYVAAQKFVEQQPDALKTVIKFIAESNAALVNNKQEFTDIVTQATGLPRDIAYLAVIHRNYGFAYIDEEIIKEQQKVAEVFFKLKLINKLIDVKDAVWSPSDK